MTARANILNLNQGLIGGVAGSMGRDEIGDSVYRNLQIPSFGFPSQTFSGNTSSNFFSVVRRTSLSSVPVDLVFHLNSAAAPSEFVLDFITFYDLRTFNSFTIGNYPNERATFANVTNLGQYRFLTIQPNQYLGYRFNATTAGTNRTFGFEIRNWSYRNELLDTVSVTYTASAGGGTEP